LEEGLPCEDFWKEGLPCGEQKPRVQERPRIVFPRREMRPARFPKQIALSKASPPEKKISLRHVTRRGGSKRLPARSGPEKKTARGLPAFKKSTPAKKGRKGGTIDGQEGREKTTANREKEGQLMMHKPCGLLFEREEHFL